MAERVRRTRGHRCPVCRAEKVVRDYPRNFLERWMVDHLNRLPYRCRDCGKRFYDRMTGRSVLVREDALSKHTKRSAARWGVALLGTRPSVWVAAAAAIAATIVAGRTLPLPLALALPFGWTIVAAAALTLYDCVALEDGRIVSRMENLTARKALALLLALLVVVIVPSLVLTALVRGLL